MAIATASKRLLDLYWGTSHVIGQDQARQLMAVLIDRQWDVSEGRIEQANGALVGGRSGSGKTMLVRAMCQLSGLAFAETNATRYTEAGYAGLDLNKMFIPLMESAAAMKDKAQPDRQPPKVPSVLHREDISEVAEIASRGVVLLDEFDKWMLRENHVTGRKDTAIQADLLKMIEGSQEYISDNEDEVGILFDTTKVLIICAGAFVKLQGLVARRLDKPMDDITIWDQITQEDIESYGVLPELAGRLATHIFLKPLGIESMAAILTAPGGLLDEWRGRFEAAGCRWAVDDAGVRDIVSRSMQHQMGEQVLKRETGARAIEHVCWVVFARALFQAKISDHPVKVSYAPMQHRAILEAV